LPKLIPVSRVMLIKRLRKLGFEGPFQGGRHQYMIRGERRLTLPNPHKKEIQVDLLSRILRQADISREEWLKIS